MKVTELNREQLDELKQTYWTEWLESKGEQVSYDELMTCPDYISNGFIFNEYAGYTFSNDDFFCTAGL